MKSSGGLLSLLAAPASSWSPPLASCHRRGCRRWMMASSHTHPPSIPLAIPNNIKCRAATNDDDDGRRGDDDDAMEATIMRLRERAMTLRAEARAAERDMHDERRRRKEMMDDDADRDIERLLLLPPPPSSSSLSSSDEDDGASSSMSMSSSLSSDEMTSGTNDRLPTAEEIATRFRAGRMSRESLLRVVDRLHEIETLGMDGRMGNLSRDGRIEEGSSSSFVLGDYENNNAERKRMEGRRVAGLLDRILEAASIVDIVDDGGRGSSSERSSLASELRTRVSDLRGGRDATFRRRVDTLLHTKMKKKSDHDGSMVGRGDGVIEGYARRSIDGGGEDDRDRLGGDGKERRTLRRKEAERTMRRLVETPPWLPPYLATYAASSTGDILPSHLKILRTELLIDVGFKCASWDANDFAAVFRGRWEYSRSGADGGGGDKRIVLGGTYANNDVEGRTIAAAFMKLQEKVENHAQLRDSIRLFHVYDNEWQSTYESFSLGGAAGNQRLRRDVREGMAPPSVIIALPKDVTPEQECSTANRFLAVMSTLLTAFATLTYALGACALNPTFFHAIVKENDVAAVPMCLPIFVGTLAVSACHELGHLIAARRRGVKLGRPVPLPSLQVGTFGSITPLRSFPSSRVALFDVAAAGPGASILISILFTFLGLSLTITSRSLTSLPVVPAAVMKSSFLIGQIVTIVAPTMMLAPLSQPVPVHPLFLVGLAGLVFSAVNMLPIGRLDGGRACAAVFGRRVASLISFMSLIVLAYYSLFGGSGIAAFWGSLLILTRQRLADVPCVDEVTGVGDFRAYIYVGVSFLALLTLLPFMGGVGPI